MTDRDRLLAASHRLLQGASFGHLSSAECESAYETVRTLAPKVPPRDAGDTTVSALPRTLFYMAGNCSARPGGCSAARRAFDASFPQDALASIKDPKARHYVKDTSFESLVPRCTP